MTSTAPSPAAPATPAEAAIRALTQQEYGPLCKGRCRSYAKYRVTYRAMRGRHPNRKLTTVQDDLCWAHALIFTATHHLPDPPELDWSMGL